MQTATETEYRDGDLTTFRLFARENQAWTESSLRWLRFTAHQNGAAEAGVFVQQGRRVLIDKPAFWRWVRHPQKRAAA